MSGKTKVLEKSKESVETDASSGGSNLPVIPLLLAGFVVVTLLYMSLIPAWLPYDEPSHFYYVAYIAGLPGFPHPIPAGQSGLDYEFYIQPLLAYLLYSPFLKAVSGAEVILQLFILRFVTVIIGTATVFINLQIISTLIHKKSGQKKLLTLTGAIIIFNPAFVAVHATVTNDALYNLLTACSLLLAIKLVKDPLPQQAGWYLIGLGLMLGLDGMTKALALPLLLIPLVVVVVRAKTFGKKQALWPWLIPALLPGLALAMPAYLNRLISVGDPFGTNYLRTLGNSQPMGLNQLGTFFSMSLATFWFFVNFLRNALTIKPWLIEYFPYAILSIMPLLSFAKMFRSKSLTRLLAPENIVIAITLGLSLGAYIFKNLQDFGPEARYLFGVFGPIAYLITTSVIQLVPDKNSIRWRVSATLILFLMLYCLFSAVRYLGNAPDLYPNLYR